MIDDPSADRPDSLRRLPSVDALLRHPTLAPLQHEFPHGELLAVVRGVLDDRREAIRKNRFSLDALEPHRIALDVRAALHARQVPHLRRVINATGIVLHTGLGRAPLAAEAIEAIAEVASGYSNLELDLADGRRGDRHAHVAGLLRELCGVQDALVVNNNAAATLLTLHALAGDQGVVVSRGQLVEIGGSYRMPDIMSAAGCRMIEVGTTNRTHPEDFEAALVHDPAALLRVHTSNYRITGFTRAVTISELAAIRDRYPTLKLLVIDDLGSGLLDRGLPGMADWDEPSVRESLADGADLTLFSGDKLLGGPQAGIIVGRSDLLARLRRDPLARALRPDKLTLAGLEATLRLYRDPAALRERLPILRMLLRGDGELRSAAERLAEALSRAPGCVAEARPDESFAGGGSLPSLPFATWTVRLRHRGRGSDELAAALRERDLPVICRLRDGALVFDCRTLSESDLDDSAAAVMDVVRA